jgi:hypothetical protein
MQQLRIISTSRHLSIAKLIRESLDQWLSLKQSLAQEVLKDRAKKAVGRFQSGKKDTANHHDRYLAESYS